jgi:hypothetical protein
VKLLVSLVAAVAASPFGLYHHVTPGDLDRDSTRRELTSDFNLVTVRGDNGDTSGAVGALLKDRGTTKVFLYRRGTAVSAGDLDTTHPEWLARDRAGQVITSNASGQVIDITQPAVRAWLTDGVARDVEAGGYDGVYLDVLGSFFSSRFYSGRPVINGEPLKDSAWRDASVALIKEVKTATGKPVIANGFGLQSGKNYEDHKADSDLLIDAADGIQIEQFVRNGNLATDKYASPARWQADIDFLRDVGRLNKIVLADTRVRDGSDKAATARQENYALASFLVGAEGPARFRFAIGAATGDVDGSIADTVNALGAPKGSARRDGDALVRAFSGGSVRVDPVAHTASIATTRSPNVVATKRSNRSPLYAAIIAVVIVVAGVVTLRRGRSRE